jgi:hypothetical protein
VVRCLCRLQVTSLRERESGIDTALVIEIEQAIGALLLFQVCEELQVNNLSLQCPCPFSYSVSSPYIILHLVFFTPSPVFSITCFLPCYEIGLTCFS